MVPHYSPRTRKLTSQNFCLHATRLFFRRHRQSLPLRPRSPSPPSPSTSLSPSPPSPPPPQPPGGGEQVRGVRETGTQTAGGRGGAKVVLVYAGHGIVTPGVAGTLRAFAAEVEAARLRDPSAPSFVLRLFVAVCVCVCVCLCVCVCVRVYICMHICDMYIYTFIHTHIHTYKL